VARSAEEEAVGPGREGVKGRLAEVGDKTLRRLDAAVNGWTVKPVGSEGYRTAESFHGLCRERGIDAPILAEVYRMLYEAKPPAAVLAALMNRGLRSE
jgi:glycerol-3-phosphate dehydrogenase